MEILVGYDGSNTAKAAIRLAKIHAKAFNARVYVVTCITQIHEVKTHEMDKMDSAEQELDQLKNEFAGEGIPCEARLLVGDLEPGERMVQFANDTNVSEIIIGVRRRSKVGKLLFGSTAQYVILEAPCPVVAVK